MGKVEASIVYSFFIHFSNVIFSFQHSIWNSIFFVINNRNTSRQFHSWAALFWTWKKKEKKKTRVRYRSNGLSQHVRAKQRTRKGKKKKTVTFSWTWHLLHHECMKTKSQCDNSTRYATQKKSDAHFTRLSISIVSISTIPVARPWYRTGLISHKQIESIDWNASAAHRSLRRSHSFADSSFHCMQLQSAITALYRRRV